MLKVGDRVPDCTTVDHTGNTFTPADGICPALPTHSPTWGIVP
jgi:hypothetical protein